MLLPWPTCVVRCYRYRVVRYCFNVVVCVTPFACLFVLTLQLPRSTNARLPFHALFVTLRYPTPVIRFDFVWRLLTALIPLCCVTAVCVCFCVWRISLHLNVTAFGCTDAVATRYPFAARTAFTIVAFALPGCVVDLRYRAVVAARLVALRFDSTFTFRWLVCSRCVYGCRLTVRSVGFVPAFVAVRYRLLPHRLPTFTAFYAFTGYPDILIPTYPCVRYLRLRLLPGFYHLRLRCYIRLVRLQPGFARCCVTFSAAGCFRWTIRALRCVYLPAFTLTHRSATRSDPLRCWTLFTVLLRRCCVYVADVVYDVYTRVRLRRDQNNRVTDARWFGTAIRFDTRAAYTTVVTRRDPRLPFPICYRPDSPEHWRCSVVYVFLLCCCYRYVLPHDTAVYCSRYRTRNTLLTFVNRYYPFVPVRSPCLFYVDVTFVDSPFTLLRCAFVAFPFYRLIGCCTFTFHCVYVDVCCCCYRWPIVY